MKHAQVSKRPILPWRPWRVTLIGGPQQVDVRIYETWDEAMDLALKWVAS